MGEIRNVYRMLARNPGDKRPLIKARSKLENNIKKIFKLTLKIVFGVADRSNGCSCDHDNESFFHKSEGFLDQLSHS
jgi:hypothetical protein